MTRILYALLSAAVLSGCSPAPASRTPAPPAAPVAPAPPAPPQAATSGTRLIGVVDDPQALQTFLRLKAIESRGSPPPSVVARTVDGGPRHPRITLVYMSSPDWCGSGGCRLFVLEPGHAGLEELAGVTLVHPPVLILDTRTHGMPDIAVRVRGDYYPGEGEKTVVLPFDGRTYASNPTVPPARLLQGTANGEIAISEDQVAMAFRR